jgi:3-phosphoshikimate 1-carboxyvinyltransferase
MAKTASTARIAPRKLSGSIDAISSKSDVHRILICSALCGGETRVRFTTLSEDIRSTIGCLCALGASVEKQGDDWVVGPIGKALKEPVLDCGESGSTLRFLLPVAAALGANATFIGAGRLPERPLGPLLEEMKRHGGAMRADRLPMKIEGKLAPAEYVLPGDVSSQFVTGLLLALPLLGGESTIRLTTPLQSKPYVDMTIRTLALFGIEIKPLPDGYLVPGGQVFLSPGEVTAEGDWSNAAYWLCAGALGGPVTCRGLQANSLQGDCAVLSILDQFGANVAVEGNAVTVSGGALRAADIDASAIPDLVTALVAVAAGASGTTHIVNAGRLRIKESDRLSALATNLRALGAQVEEHDDRLFVVGRSKLDGGTVDGCGDHRIVMSAAILSVLCGGDVVITGAQAIAKSYPDFFSDFAALGGDVVVEHQR